VALDPCIAFFVPITSLRNPAKRSRLEVTGVLFYTLDREEDERMAGIGIPQVDALARAERGLGTYRLWTREQALAKGATTEALEEYIRTTARLLELDQQYWQDVSAANTALVEARRGALSPNERLAITDRTHAPFQDLFREYQERVRPLLARLPGVLQSLGDTRRRRDWVMALDSALTCYALAVQDTVEALREERRTGTAPLPKEAAIAEPEQ
jgi:hypothetical protein